MIAALSRFVLAHHLGTMPTVTEYRMFHPVQASLQFSSPLVLSRPSNGYAARTRGASVKISFSVVVHFSRPIFRRNRDAAASVSLFNVLERDRSCEVQLS